MIRITYVTITFNAAKVLQRTLDSVLQQDYPNIVHLIIDGASTDDTMKLVDDYIARSNVAENGHRIQVTSEPDKGIYDAMNKGAKLASGMWINYMNSGDTFTSPNVLKKIFSNPIPDNINLLYSDHYIPQPNGTKMLVPDDMAHSPYRFCHQCIIYRRSMHAEHGYYVVTNKLIIGDSLFFYSIPDDEKIKVDIVIANYQGGGASDQSEFDIFKQNVCAELVYRNRSFANIIWSYYSLYLRHKLIPNGLRQKLRAIFGRVEIKD